MNGIILTEEALREQVEYFMAQSSFVFDIESINGPLPGTRGVPAHNKVVWISMATHGRTIAIPMGHPTGSVLLKKKTRKLNKETRKFEETPAVYSDPPEQLRPSVVYEILRPLFFNPNILKIAHNATTDFVSVAKYFGAIPCGPVADTIVLQWLLDENIGSFDSGPKRPMRKGLKDLVKWYFRVDYDQESTGKCIEIHPFNKVARYAMLDARYTWTLFLKFDAECRAEDLVAHRALEEKLTEVLFHMNLEGAPVDVEAIRELEVELSAELELIEARVYKAAGKVFNINSPKQKQDILYGFKKDGGQGLKTKRLTKGGAKKKKDGLPIDIYDWSTDKEALEEFVGNELVDVLIEYASIKTLLGTYVHGYLGEEGNPDKPCRIFYGRVHADLVQYGTVSSRFSCREPNLQNIPRPGTPLGKKVRGLFRAPKGYKLVVADYAQVEYRVLAHYLGFGILFDGFHSGLDAHKATAAAMYNVAIEDVTSEMRQDSKGLGFGTLFGAMANKIAAMLKQPVAYAQEKIDDYDATQPEVGQLKRAVCAAAKKRKVPHITTLTGFKRRVWDLQLPDTRDTWGARMRAERQVFNSLIQGGAAGLIKMAMVRMYDLLKEDWEKNPSAADRISLILSVHDELVLLAPEHRAEEAKAMLEEAMTGKEMQDMLKVPLEADAKIVDRWSEAK